MVPVRLLPRRRGLKRALKNSPLSVRITRRSSNKGKSPAGCLLPPSNWHGAHPPAASKDFKIKKPRSDGITALPAPFIRIASIVALATRAEGHTDATGAAVTQHWALGLGRKSSISLSRSPPFGSSEIVSNHGNESSDQFPRRASLHSSAKPQLSQQLTSP